MTNHSILKTLLIAAAAAGFSTLAHSQGLAYRATELLALDSSMEGAQAHYFGLTETGDVMGGASLAKYWLFQPVRWDAAGQAHDMGAATGPLQHWVSGANDTGTFVGGAWEPQANGDSLQLGLTWQSGTLTRSRQQTGADFVPETVNNKGWQGGYVMQGPSKGWQDGRLFEGTVLQAAVWDGQSLKVLPGLGGNASVKAVHESGLVVGSARDLGTAERGPVAHAVAWRDGQLTDLGREGDAMSWVASMNDAGTVLVGHHDAQYRTSFELWDGQTFAPVDLSRTSETQHIMLNGMTDDGAYWGFSQDLMLNNRRDATIWREGLAYNLNDAFDPLLKAQGWHLNEVLDINGAGQLLVLGDKVGADGMAVSGAGFVLTPVPEPDALLMGLLGLGMMGCLRRRLASPRSLSPRGAAPGTGSRHGYWARQSAA